MQNNNPTGELRFQLYIYFQKAAYTFANSTVQKTSKMSIIIDTIYHKAAPNRCSALEKLCSLINIIILNTFLTNTFK